jgi:hypothetical protein
MRNNHNLRLFTGDKYDSFMEEIVDDFVASRVKGDRSLSDSEVAHIQQYFDMFIEFCAEHASDKIVLDNGKMTPLVTLR